MPRLRGINNDPDLVTRARLPRSDLALWRTSTLQASYTAVIPARNAAATIEKCINALRAAQPRPSRIIVYDDASTDSTAARARALGAEVIAGPPGPLGPATARNAASANVETDVILFVDSDVQVEVNAAALLLQTLDERPDVAAAFGSYGARQHAPNVAARYANLRHHYVHQNGAGAAETFWTGLGAVRRTAFVDVGGFNEAYSKPCMEDIDLGYRLRQHGWQIRLVPEAQGAHLKNWTLRQLWHDDVFTRALPWSRMLVANAGKSSLNTTYKERVAAACAALCVSLFFASLAHSHAAYLFIASTFFYYLINADFFSTLWRHGGWRVGLFGPLLHICYHLYSSTIFATVALWHHLRQVGNRGPLRQAGRQPSG